MRFPGPLSWKDEVFDPVNQSNSVNRTLGTVQFHTKPCEKVHYLSFNRPTQQRKTGYEEGFLRKCKVEESC